MILTLHVQLLPTPTQASILLASMESFSAAANWLAGEAMEAQVFSVWSLQRIRYRALRVKFALPAQVAIRVIAAVAEAYRPDKTTQVVFHPLAPLPLDNQMLCFRQQQAVSVLTAGGRLVLSFMVGGYSRDMISAAARRSMLSYEDGLWVLLTPVEIPDKLIPDEIQESLIPPA